MTAETENLERLQRFLIVRRKKSGKLDVIGTNGGLPFVAAAAEKHKARLIEIIGGSYQVLEISKLRTYLQAHGYMEVVEDETT